MADLTDLEIARVGKWNLKSGELEVTEAMLRDAAEYAARADSRPAPVRLGHDDPRFDGEPALGWLTDLRVEGTGNDTVLRGSITGMPDWLVRAAPSAWPDRSMEGWTDYEVDGRTYAMVIDGLALLGVTPPGMSTIRSLRDLPSALGIAASARIAATVAPRNEPANPQVPTDAAQAARLIHRAPIKGSDRKEATVEFTDAQLATLRATLGLSDDKELQPAALLAAIGELKSGTPESKPDDGTTGTTEANKTDEPAKVAAAPTKQTAGTLVIDASAWEEREARIKRLEAAAAKRAREERDQIIDGAIRAGKFAFARKEHWARLWDADPDGTREVIAGLTKNVIPVEALGSAEDDGSSIDDEFAHLFPPSTNVKGA